MEDRFSRTELVFGIESLQRLKSARVAVFGLGGVGSYAVEALARSGVGTIDVIDSDKVCLSNINRQLYALDSSVGEYKVDMAEERCKDINPEIHIVKHKMFYLPETSGELDFGLYDYVVDAIDTVTGKLEIIKRSFYKGVPMISAMGTGGKTDPTALEVSDIYSTSVCPLARIMRKLCRENGIDKLKVVYSKEPPASQVITSDSGKRAPGSTSFVPPVAGLIMAGEVIKDILNYNRQDV